MLRRQLRRPLWPPPTRAMRQRGVAGGAGASRLTGPTAGSMCDWTPIRCGNCGGSAPGRSSFHLGFHLTLPCPPLSPLVTQNAAVYSTRVHTLGRYVFILHYHQPLHPRFPVQVYINGGRIWQGRCGHCRCGDQATPPTS